MDPAWKQFQASLQDPRARLPGLKAENDVSEVKAALLWRFLRPELVGETSGISLELRVLQELLSITSITSGGVSSSDTRTSSLDQWN